MTEAPKSPHWAVYRLGYSEPVAYLLGAVTLINLRSELEEFLDYYDIAHEHITCVHNITKTVYSLPAKEATP